jgi:phosphotransferase system enzyme I (PtsI)
MARGLSLPSVVSLHGVTRAVQTGDTVILDGFNGRLIVNPSPNTLEIYRRLQERYHWLLEDEKTLAPLPAVTKDGHPVTLLANMEFREEIELVKQFGAEGVGLFRTEFLFLMHGFKDYTEEEQYSIYRDIVHAIAPNPTTFRLLDLGGDKLLPVAHREQNPFLGWRGIRILLDKPELLKPQLRALLRASMSGPVRILVPMISNLSEVRRIKALLEATKQELRDQRIPFDESVPMGIMVEVPSVALMADQYAREVDFFSIGTNDLTQYILAVDRGNDLVSDRYEELDPAVLAMIARTTAAADEAGIPVSICGEMASDPLATAILIGLGLSSLSASPTFLPEIKRVIRSMQRIEAKTLAERVMRIYDPAERRKTLMDWLKEHAPGYYAFLKDSENSSQEIDS